MAVKRGHEHHLVPALTTRFKSRGGSGKRNLNRAAGNDLEATATVEAIYFRGQVCNIDANCLGNNLVNISLLVVVLRVVASSR